MLLAEALVGYSTLCRSSSHCATSNAVYLHMQSTGCPAPAAASSNSSGHTSVSSVARLGPDDNDDDDDDDDDEVRMINIRREFVEVDSGLVPDLLTADVDCSATAWRLLAQLTELFI